MNAVFWKEIKENLKWALLGMLIFSIVIIYAWMRMMDADRWESRSESICGSTLLILTTFGSAVIGSALGLLQTLPEKRHPDHWAFLIHRPVSPRVIFCGKIYAGISLYLTATVIPFTFLAYYASLKGSISAPFDWQMSLPGYADVLTGIVFYFAGLLTGMREARWFGSKAWGIAAALTCSALVSFVPEFSQALFIIVTYAGILGLAARGSFLSSGTYSTQPWYSKCALGCCLVTGVLLLGAVAGAVILQPLFSGMHYSEESSSYAILRDGQIAIVKADPYAYFTVKEVTDLNGNSLNFSKERLSNFARERLDTVQLLAPSPELNQSSYRSSERFYLSCSNFGDVLWYFVFKNGLLYGFKREDHQFIGVLGPQGFSQTDNGSIQRFSPQLLDSMYWHLSNVFAFPDSVYWLDASLREVTPIFIPTKNEIVRGSCQLGQRRWGREEAPELEFRTIVASESSIKFYHSKNQMLFETPYHFEAPYGSIIATYVPKNDRYYLWYDPRLPGNYENVPGLDSYIVEISGNGQRLHTHTLPQLKAENVERDWVQYAVFMLCPLVLSAVAAACAYVGQAAWLLEAFSGEPEYFLMALKIQAIAGCLAACIIFGITKSYAFSNKHSWIWSFIGFFTGIPGLLMFICIQEWPAKEPCSNCAKKRVVDRDKCEHCGTEFLPPKLDGTEIFEAVGYSEKSSLKPNS
jgi:hypothetical protein